MANLSPLEKPDQKRDKPFWINGLPEKTRSKIRVQKRTGCWLWQGTIRPARMRRRTPRYAGRVHDVFGDPFSLEREAALPEVWDGRTGKKVAAHRFIRSVLTCVPIEAVPRLGRCRESYRCVSPWHNIEIGPPPPVSKALGTVEPAPSTASETGTVVDVLAVLRERRPFTGFQIPNDFPLIERECDLPIWSLTMSDWINYIEWSVENPDDDD